MGGLRSGVGFRRVAACRDAFEALARERTARGPPQRALAVVRVAGRAGVEGAGDGHDVIVHEGSVAHVPTGEDCGSSLIHSMP